MKKHLLLASLALSAFLPVASSLAADLDMPLPPPPPPPPVTELRSATYDWSGAYVGGWIGNACIDGTLRDNIAIGAPFADDVTIVAAAEAAGLTDFVNRHPDGFDMMIGERGDSLSGGQRQGVAIARAMLMDPPILLGQRAHEQSVCRRPGRSSAALRASRSGPAHILDLDLFEVPAAAHYRRIYNEHDPLPVGKR